MANRSSDCGCVWQLKTKAMHFGRVPKIMGIVNVTPDSFSDGGKFIETSSAVEHALRLDQQGADILDIGGESTRPYSQGVSAKEELGRIVPVIEELASRTKTPISIDTSKAAVAQAAIDAGATIINDVTGLEGDPEMIDVAARNLVGVCAMHMQGTPQTMQDNPDYENVTKEILDYLDARKDFLIAAGISNDHICLDPGIGFGKTHEHNLQLIDDCDQFLKLGRPILVGHSRKGFIGKVIGDKQADRDVGTIAVSLRLAQKGIHIIRVHNVKATMDALKVFDAIGGIDTTGHKQI